ncbi:MAG: PaaI family thioesterase [Sphingobium sp.]
MTEPPRDDRRWELVSECGPFADLIGPMYASQDMLEPGEGVRFGFRVAPQHCNPRPVCHGGMLASFLDIALARGIRTIWDLPAPLPTITLSLDYLAPATLGEWIDARVSVIRVGGSTCFAQALLHGPSVPVLRGSGVFKHYGGAARNLHAGQTTAM